jgi:predicted DNA-binding transcriptional regulator AlpA
MGSPHCPFDKALVSPELSSTCRSLSGDSVDYFTMPKAYEEKQPMLRTAEAAEYCGSSASTFEKLRLTGGGPVYSKIGRRVVYRVDDLDAWLAANQRRSTSDTGQT